MWLAEFTIPAMPPSVNDGYVAGRQRGVKYSSKALKAWKEMAPWFIRQRLPVAMYEVEFEFHCPWICKNGRPAKKDATNFVKYAEDSLAAGIGVDDRYFMKTTIVKRDSAVVKTVIRIKPLV